MAFNGAGTFARIYNWVADKANNVKITASRMDAEMDGFATGLSTCLTKDGQTQPTADLPMNAHRHTGVAAGTARTHYADVGSEQDGAFHWCGTAGGTANALTLTPSPAIGAYAAGQVFRFTAGASANSGAATIAVSGLAAKAVQINGAALSGGEILAGKTYDVLYDGAQFQLFGSVTFPTYTAVGQANQGSGHAAFSIKGLAASEAQLKLIQNNATDDGWLFNADGPGGGILRLQRRQSSATTDVARIGTTGAAVFGGTGMVTQSILTVQGGSLSVTGSDTNFAAGGNRMVMDKAGTGRLGAIAGGGAAYYLDLLSNSATVLSFGASGTVFSSSAGNVSVTGDYLPEAGGTRNVGSSSLYFSRIYSKRLSLLDSDNSNTVELNHSGNLSANRSFNLDLSDASRTLTLTADATISGSPVIQGVHEFYVDAGAMLPAATNGPSAGTSETSTNKVNYATLDFDQTTREYVWFKIRMPKSWNNGTITFIPHWGAASGSGGVVWELGGVAVSDGDALDTAISSAQTSTDTLIATADLQSGPESSAITIGGSPAAGDVVYFRLSRLPADASDTLNADAKLHGITVRMTVSAASDA